jgi:GR25 family glycosyltransferase involved in LPS biosynthesis
MKCVYINLDSATDRRRRIEASLAASVPPGVQVVRFPAVPAAEAQQTPGKISPGAKGCFLSHLRILESAIEDPAPLVILEDDAVISPRAFGVIDQALRSSHLEWDLLFTDVGIGALDHLLKLARVRGDLIREGNFRLVDLKDMSFFGSAGYVVKPGSKAKVLAALRQAQRLDVPYDIYLRRLVVSGQIKARACFPFVTTIEESGSSQIQADEHAFADQTLNTYRRLMFVDRDLGRTREQAKTLLDRAATDEAAELTGLVFWALTSDHFPHRR